MKKLLCIIWGLVSINLGLAQEKQYSFADLEAMNGQIQSMVYQQYADTALKIYYRKPDGKTGLDPAIIFIHGGAWTAGAANTFFPYINYFSIRGMVGISIDYGLIAKESDDIMNCIADCRSAIRFVRSHAMELGVDTNRIAISGESAGGHLAACMVMLAPPETINEPFKAQALVLLNPVLNLATPTFVKYLDAGLLRKKNINADSLMNIASLVNKAKNISPLFLSYQNVPKTLLINGTEDKTTPPNFAEQFIQKLNKVGNGKLVLLPNTAHAFAVAHYRAPESITVSALETVDRFLIEAKLIKGKPQITSSGDPNWIIKR